MKTINRNGIKYELLTRIVTPHQPAIPEILAVVGQPEILYQPAVSATYDANNIELTPYIPEVPYQPFIQAVEYVAGVPKVLEVTEEYEDSIQCGIEIPIPANTSISVAHKRTAEMMSMFHEIDLNITVQIRINYYTPTGIPMLKAIANDNTLRPDAKAQLSDLFQSFVMQPKSTRDTYINPMTLGVVSKDETGNYPIGSMRQLEVLQRISDTQLIQSGLVTANETSSQQRVYRMMIFSILNIITREGI